VTWLTRNRAASNRLDQRVTPRPGLWGRPRGSFERDDQEHQTCRSRGKTMSRNPLWSIPFCRSH